MKGVALGAFLALAACGPVPGFEEARYLSLTKPSEWSGPDLESARARGAGAFCALYNRGVRASADAPLQQIPYDRSDFTAIERELRGMGLTARDIELLRRRSQTYGTGQTYAGLSCSLGYAPRVNRSFYPGTGNQWQAVLGQYGPYVYLRGDGTPSGMRVYAWN